MKELTFAEFCSLIEGHPLKITQRSNLGWSEIDGYSCELLERTYAMRTPDTYIQLGETAWFSFEVSLWVNPSRCMKIVIIYNQCEYFKAQEFVLIDEDKICRLREILKNNTQ